MASTLFEIFLALQIKYVDHSDDNNNGDYHISSVIHHHLHSKVVLVGSIMIILFDHNCRNHSSMAYIASF